MNKSVKFGCLGTIILIILCLSGVSKSEAASIDDGFVGTLSRITRVIDKRVSDLIQYLVLQKKYIFDNFTDPNDYAGFVPSADFEKTIDTISSLATASSTKPKATSTPIITDKPVASGKPIPVSTTTVPRVVPATTTPAVKPVGQSAPIVPGLVFNIFSVDDIVPDADFESTIETAPVSGSKSMILTLTNQERSANSLKPLISNALLDTIAELRIDDLFSNQYFEHDSPDGKSAPDLAKSEGYEYLLIGENLALGNFEGDQGIVSAWMASPGHRANILNNKYRELGVAQRVDTFKGNNLTIAVQIFGQPANVCAKPSSSTKKLIDTSTASITKLQAEAKKAYETLNSLKSDPNVDKSYYNQKIQEYNYFAKNINEAVAKLKKIVEDYNLQINQYNSCISS